MGILVDPHLFDRNEMILSMSDPFFLSLFVAVGRDEEVINNEGLGRKSSKRCCIFHKQRAFGESSTDSSESELDGSDSSSTSGDENDQKREGKLKRNKKIAGPKKGKKAPDSQRYHA